jgi:DNA polymerase IV
VVPDREAKSLGHEQTFEVDLAEPEEVRAVLLGQIEQVARRFGKHHVFARTVALKPGYGNFEAISRSLTLDRATSNADASWTMAKIARR